jgi:FKBP-type peptidyl-prolyl cis-trans isomerase
MKKSVLLIVCFAAIGHLYAQPGKTAVKTPVKKPATANPMKTLSDSASYAVGMSVATFYKQQGLTKLNATMVSKAITDVLGNKKSLLDDATANSVLNNYMMQLQGQKSKPNIDAGEAFLKQNKSKPGVKTTASGLQYEVLVEGNGPKPTAEDSVTCNYKGTLLNNPVPFDDSYSRGAPITFSLQGVIRGWTEGLQLMSVGSKYKFYVPYTLGYGASDYGPIPGGSMLTFEIELLEIKKK